MTGLLRFCAIICLAAATGATAETMPSRAELARVYAERDWRDTALLCDAAEQKAARASSFGCYKGHGKPRYSEFERRSIYVPMPDGTRLAVDIYRPTVKGKPVAGRLPVIFNYSRYWRATRQPGGLIDTYVGTLRPGERLSSIDAALERSGRSRPRTSVALLLAHGYVFVRAEARGTGASFGVRNGDMSGVEARDGHDMIAWIARQPWSNGRVGMIGGSYEGMSQMLVASTAPPALRSIFPQVAPFDEYRGSWSGTGVLRKFGLAWLAREAKRDGVQQGKSGSVINPDDAGTTQVPPVDDDTDGALRAAARAERLADPDAVDPTTYFTQQAPEARTMIDAVSAALGNGSPADVMETLYDPAKLEALMAKTPGLREKLTALRFYRDASPMLTTPQDNGRNNLAALAPRIRESGIAVYNWGGWRDFATVDTLQWDANLGDKAKLTVGPWTHGPNEPDDLREDAAALLGPIEQLRWADHWLKGIDNGIMREPRVHYALMGEEDRFLWRSAKAWPADAPARTLFLAGEGALQPTPAGDGTASFTVDYRAGLGDHTRYHDAIGLGPLRLPDLAIHAQHGATAFTSAPLSQDMDVVGAPIVTLAVSSSTPDADVHAYLERVESDGTIVMLADGVLRASHRVEGTAWYSDLGLPFSDSRRAVVDATPGLDATKPATMRFSLMPVAARFPAGSRVRLVVTGSDAGTNLTIPQSPATRLTVHFGSGSSLALPTCAP
jgi:putative CocE/NonD family hydrolase